MFLWVSHQKAFCLHPCARKLGYSSWVGRGGFLPAIEWFCPSLSTGWGFHCFYRDDPNSRWKFGMIEELAKGPYQKNTSPAMRLKPVIYSSNPSFLPTELTTKTYHFTPLFRAEEGKVWSVLCGSLPDIHRVYSWWKDWWVGFHCWTKEASLSHNALDMHWAIKLCHFVVHAVNLLKEVDKSINLMDDNGETIALYYI